MRATGPWPVADKEGTFGAGSHGPSASTDTLLITSAIRSRSRARGGPGRAKEAWVASRQASRWT
jgi:hypothetical protein